MGGSQSSEDSSSSSREESPQASAQSSSSPSEREPLDFDKALNAVAAQVYDNVHTQLEDLQKEKLAKTQAMAKDIKSKLEPAVHNSGGKPVCEAEVKAVVDCLKGKGGTSLLKCDSVIESLKRCSAAAATA